MAGRGRGRGRGGTSTFSREQLNSMGFSASEALPAVVTAPPPLFPPLERKPVHLTVSHLYKIYLNEFNRNELKKF